MMTKPGPFRPRHPGTCIHSCGMPDGREFFLPDKKIFRGPQQS